MEQVEKLKALGFDLGGDAQSPFVADKAKCKTTNVPSRWKKDPKLAKWARYQKTKQRSDDRIDHSHQIGYEWDNQKQIDWIGCKNTTAYKKKHNIVTVSFGQTRLPAIGSRCSINKIGFVWDVWRNSSDWRSAKRLNSKKVQVPLAVATQNAALSVTPKKIHVLTVPILSICVWIPPALCFVPAKIQCSR